MPSGRVGDFGFTTSCRPPELDATRCGYTTVVRSMTCRLPIIWGKNNFSSESNILVSVSILGIDIATGAYV